MYLENSLTPSTPPVNNNTKRIKESSHSRITTNIDRHKTLDNELTAIIGKDDLQYQPSSQIEQRKINYVQLDATHVSSSSHLKPEDHSNNTHKS